MRITVVSWSRRKVGGLETYIETIIPELLRRGHDVSFLAERDVPSDRNPLSLPTSIEKWCVAESGIESTISKVREWSPDVLFTQHLTDSEFELETLDLAPAVYFMHGYFGSCISGTKSFKSPVVIPCDRVFGWKCLLHYYPHRCGGLNPVTMLKQYSAESARHDRLRRYRMIVTNSKHIESEVRRHGLEARCIYCPVTVLPQTSSSRISDRWRLLFIGRMDLLKGGRTFIESLPQVCERAGKRVHITFAGDGPDRSTWERDAERAQSRIRGLEIEFVGWLDNEQRDRMYANSDLLVVPSLWPEPFGLVGPEAGLHGVPAAAFAVGGIPEWLNDGVNGFLASSDPPTSDGLAEAIVKCLSDEHVHERLRHGAKQVAERFTSDRHLDALLEVFETVCGRAAIAGTT